MNNKYLIKLLKMIKDVNNIKNKDTKTDKIHEISAYGAYLYYIGLISNNDFTNVINSIRDYEDEINYKEQNEYIDDILKNNNMLNHFFWKNLIIYWEYIVHEQIDNININIEKEFNEFLKYINCYELYNTIKRKEQISFQSSILNHSICLDNGSDSFIIIKNTNKFHEYLDLSHEIAHALENKLLSKYKRCFGSPYNIEMLSITFNRMFIEYLYQNNAITKEELFVLLSNFESNYLGFMKVSALISNSIFYGDYVINDYDISIFCEGDIINLSLTDLNYAIGRIAAFKLFDEWKKSDITFIKSIPNLVDDIYHMSIKDIIKTFGNNEKLINNELSKTFIKK